MRPESASSSGAPDRAPEPHRRQAPMPLAGIRSIKTKWSIVIVAAVAVTAMMSLIGLRLGWPIWVRPVIAGALALLMVQALARGMTRPLRQMAVSAEAMAGGDYTTRVEVATNDEVGRLAASFNRMATALGDLDRQQKEFVANASHELRTPVAALQTTLENLVDGIGQPDRRTLEQMLAQAEHLGRLVSQLLDLSRLEAGADQLGRAEVDVGDLLHELTGHLRVQHPTALIETRAPMGLKVVGDRERLDRVLTNIIGNGIRFSPLGSPVTVVASHHRGTVRIAVRDQGPGIPEHERTRVFERFWQADGSRLTGQGGGAGLGLAISKAIIDQHDGRIEILDNDPTGACVIVTLPSIT